MKVRLFVLGKLKEPALKVLCEDYIQRIQRFHDFVVEEIPDESIHAKIPVEKILEKEAERILNKLKPGAMLVLLDVRGQQLTSEALAKQLESWLQAAVQEIVFVIGSAHGFSQSLKERAQFRLSLSKLTFPHQLVRVIALEQIYRAWTVIKNIKYHY
ncbi:MAG: 23S rRNA (pseudouridine(1915)-N(3))-methyltransferase RlmH [Deltaproteobacteria bacterium]|nr:23S rRNA (pseudouridine(1915)-N(3))-methyltransferase RlmH [Deltaproteobacteria bacterium]